MQLNVVAVAPDRNDTDRVCAIGECTAGAEAIGLGELARLDQLVSAEPKRIPETAKRLLFARHGFTAELRRAARKRPDVELVDLQRLYHGN